MKKVTYFHLDTCPYCIQADQVIAELVAENPRYGQVIFEKIDETKNPEIADQYDYYANPSMFIGREKIYEAHLFETREECRQNVLRVLERALED